MSRLPPTRADELFPVDAILEQVRASLARVPNLVVQAPPGAGKTTRLPLALLDDPASEAWLRGRKLVMLEPRRLAARAAARFMARTLGEEPGGTVGYRVRLDTKVSARTRLEVVTEGVLTRMLQDDPELASYGAVLFDEFHERSIHADLGLALTLEAQRALRPDLRVIVMSATLDGARVAALLTAGPGAELAPAPVVSSAGRAFPVATHFAPPPALAAGARYASRSAFHGVGHLVAVVLRALREEPGSVLAFLPGQAEIRRAADLLAGQVPREVEVVPLYGDMEGTAQDAAIRPASAGRRKVVLATAIAESSLTIEGVRVVVDSGQSRVPRFDVASGMGRLETVRVSRASADQRRGRAGRIEPGVCYRLWSEGEDQRLAAHSTPEILEADLVPLALELSAWGVRDARVLAWLDPPKEASLAQARELLGELGALDAAGAISAHGRAMLAVPLHPRLAHLCLGGRALGVAGLACEVAALLSDRDPIRTERDAPDSDLRLRVAALRDRSLPGHPLPPGARVDEGRRQQARALVRDLRQRLRVTESDDDLDQVGLLVALAYPDRVAQARGAGRFRMRNGRGAHFDKVDALCQQEFIAIANLDGAGADARIWLAAPLARAALERGFAGQIETREVGGWDDAAGAVVARRERVLGALTLESQERRDLAPAQVIEGLLAGIRARGLGVLPWSEALQGLRQRVGLLRRVEGAATGEGGGTAAGHSWPDLSDERLLATLEEWLAPYLAGRSRLTHLKEVALGDALRGLLAHHQLRALEQEAPTHWTVPSGSVKPIDYSTEEPTLAVRLQEMFGATDTPRIARGRVALTLQLLSPAGRPVQVTRDLAGFWRSSYFDVRKDLRGRYPRHHWPEDPLTAAPTARVKRRK